MRAPGAGETERAAARCPCDRTRIFRRTRARPRRNPPRARCDLARAAAAAAFARTARRCTASAACRRAVAAADACHTRGRFSAAENSRWLLSLSGRSCGCPHLAAMCRVKRVGGELLERSLLACHVHLDLAELRDNAERLDEQPFVVVGNPRAKI